MNITTQSYSGTTTIIAQGVPTSSTFAEIDEKLSRVPPNHLKQVWLEGTHLQRIHLTQTCFCSMINKILRLHRDGVSIVLFGLNNSSQKMLRILHLDKFFQQVDTLEDTYLLIRQQYTEEEEVV